jgi:hypothetical protein
MSLKTPCPIGQKFARLKVIGEAPMHVSTSGKRITRRSACFCLCDCGKTVSVTFNDLSRGKTQSCGCALVTHGFCTNEGEHPLYRTWTAMIQRCTNPETERYEDWGGRGIKVCERWLHSFPNFLADVGERPPGKTLDRWPDKNGNYEPGNVRWATVKEQQRNMRSNRVFTVQGVTGCMIELCEHFKISTSTVKHRIDGMKWSPEKAFTTPLLIKRTRAANSTARE